MKNIHVLQKLKDMLACERFIIGGSNAMKLHGIILTKEPDDLDIIIEIPKGRTIQHLEKLQQENPNPKFTGKASMAYSFYFDGVKCDVWIKEFISEYTLLTYEGFLVNSITDVVDWKVRFKRAKDWIQLMQWSQSIFNKERFKTELMEIGSSDDYNLSNANEVPDKTPVKSQSYDPLSADEWEIDLPF